MPTKYKIILSLLVIVIGFTVIYFYNPDLSRVAFLYDYYLLPISLMFKKYGNVGVILTIQLLMLIGLWVFPEAKGKVTLEE
tara:strand:- start:2095 stop:2337 length:243 start_codon:yes stop_codon:yes gene_type:complete